MTCVHTLVQPERAVLHHLHRGWPAHRLSAHAYAPDNAVEMVVDIGEESIWGQGYGRASLAEAQKIVFFQLRRDKMIARIYNENARSRQMLVSCGFKPGRGSGTMTEYQLTSGDYLHRKQLQ